MKPLLLGLALAGVLAGPATAEPRRRPGVGTANPSALVAAEIAFNRLAREKGQWTAFREYADENGVMFVPEAVRAKDWLKGRKDPPASVQWQPYQVWMSCDGSAGVTRGAWQRPDGSVGYFTTIWKRQKKGTYRWVLDHGDTLAQSLEVPDMLSARVASCSGKAQLPPPSAPPADIVHWGPGFSADGTIYWNATVRRDGTRNVIVHLWNGKGFDPIVQDKVASGG